MTKQKTKSLKRSQENQSIITIGIIITDLEQPKHLYNFPFLPNEQWGAPEKVVLSNKLEKKKKKKNNNVNLSFTKNLTCLLQNRFIQEMEILSSD